MDAYPEYPLYRFKDGASPEYLGTTGFAFQVFGHYIYVKSDMHKLDWPDGTMTRVVNLKDLSVTTIGQHIYIFIPKQGSKVYYTWEDGCIYVADASLKNSTKLIHRSSG